ncbi:hypothetical protein FRC03_003780 [Tulasnella sp. 419]|nr:hypothetical protein FRC02_005406 [Tulasnella sp. 418]KAG8969255.1 hypothetical protein FRC03_003780 [Tulasnella sp. 419]
MSMLTVEQARLRYAQELARHTHLQWLKAQNDKLAAEQGKTQESRDPQENNHSFQPNSSNEKATTPRNGASLRVIDYALRTQGGSNGKKGPATSENW